MYKYRRFYISSKSKNPILIFYVSLGMMILVLFCQQTYAQIGIRIPDKEIIVKDLIETKDGILWLATNKGAYYIDGYVTKRIPDRDLVVKDILETIEGSLLLATNKGAYLVKGQDVDTILDENTIVFSVNQTQNGRIWFHTNNGIYFLVGDTTKRIPDKNLDLWMILELDDGRIWLGTTEGAYLVDANSAKRIPDQNIEAREIIEAGEGKVWLATSKGAYLFDGDHVERIPDKYLDVWDIEETKGGQLWLGTSKGAFRIDEDETKRVPDKELMVLTLTETKDGKMCLLTKNGFYLVDGDIVKRITDKDLIVSAFKKTKYGRVYLQTNKGVYIADKCSTKLITKQNININDIRESIDGIFWLDTKYRALLLDRQNPTYYQKDKQFLIDVSYTKKGIEIRRTNKGVYLIDGDNIKRVPDLDLYVTKIIEVEDGNVWLATSAGAYFIDMNAEISVSFEQADVFWKNILRNVIQFFTRNLVLFTGYVKPNIEYKNCDKNAYPCDSIIDGENFQIIWTINENSYKSNIEKKNYHHLEDSVIPLNFGESTGYLGSEETISYSVVDKWGNHYKGKIDALVIDYKKIEPFILPVLLYCAVILILLICFALSPVFRICNSVIMIRWVRKIQPVGLIIYLATLLTCIRIYLLIRYKKEIRKDRDISRWNKCFIPPNEKFLPKNFGYMIKQNRRLLIVGDSGIGKTVYFKYLMFNYASNKTIPPEGIIPVFISPSLYKRRTVEEMFHDQLSKYGGITDQILTKKFLELGGFLIFIDGLDEVNCIVRHEINRFVERNREANYFCLSSEKNYPDFEWIEEFKMIERT